MRLEFSYAPTKRDLVRLVRRASRRSLVSFLVFGIVMAVVGLLAVSDDEYIGGLFLLYLALMFLLLALVAVRRTVQRMPQFAFLPRTFVLDDDGIQVNTPVSWVWYAWRRSTERSPDAEGGCSMPTGST